MANKVPPNFREFILEWDSSCPTLEQLQNAYLKWLVKYYRSLTQAGRIAGVDRNTVGHRIGRHKKATRKAPLAK